MPSKKVRKPKKVIHIEQPPEQVVREMFPGLAKMQDELRAAGCQVTMKIEKIRIEIEEQPE